MTPVRLQLSRRKGFNLQDHSRSVNGLEAVNCARGPGRHLGNPFIVGKHGTRAECVRMHEALLSGLLCVSVDAECIEAQKRHLGYVKRNFRRLRGKNFACWCRGKPCHADVLLEIANR